MNDNENFLYDIQLLKELMEETISPVMASYDVLIEGRYTEETSYQLSLGFLSIANQSYLQAKVLCNEKGLERSEIYPFFDSFKNYKFELKEYIAKKDDNSSWLSSRQDQFIKDCNSSIKFISDIIKMNLK